MLSKFRRDFWSPYLQSLLSTELTYFSLSTKSLKCKSNVSSHDWTVVVPFLSCEFLLSSEAHPLTQKSRMHPVPGKDRNTVMFICCFLTVFSAPLSHVGYFFTLNSHHFLSFLIRHFYSPWVLSSRLCFPDWRKKNISLWHSICFCYLKCFSPLKLLLFLLLGKLYT